jgi:hypothetical protein
MNTTQISCTIGATDPTAGLGVEVWLNDQLLYDNNNFDQPSLPLTWDISDDDGKHELKFVLKNKTDQHTKIDEQGNIVTDATITISDLAFEEIELKQIFVEHATYQHTFNGTSDTEIIDKFYGVMGCNGTVSLKFTTPIYLWLLESM